MSQLNVDNIQNRTGSNGGPNFPSGISVAVGQTAYIHGNLQVDGTETIINTETLNVADKTVGIGSTSNASNTTADGSGIEVFASSSQTGNNKTLTWGNTANSWEFGPNDVGLKVGTGVTIYGGTGIVSATSFKGDGSLLTGIDATAIQTGNTSVQTVDTGSDGHVKMTTEGGERVRVGPAGQIGLGGANYGTSGQVITSAGSGNAPSWATIPPAGNTFTGIASGSIANNKAVMVCQDGKLAQITATNSPSSNPTSVQGAWLTDSANTRNGVAVWNNTDNVMYMMYHVSNGSQLILERWSADTSTGALTYVGKDQLTGSSSQTAKYNSDACWDSTNNKLVVMFNDTSGTNGWKYVIGTPGGTGNADLTWSSMTLVDASVYRGSCCFDPLNGKIITCYRDDVYNSGGNYLRYRVGTVSGTGGSATITWGNAGDIEALSVNATYGIGLESMGNTGKILVSWARTSGTSVRVACCEVYGNALTVGASVQCTSNGEQNSVAWDTALGKGVVVYRDNTQSNYARGNVVSVSGTTVTLGTAITVDDATAEYFDVVYNAKSGGLWHCMNQSGSLQTKIVGLSISGTTLSADSETMINGGQDDHMQSVASWNGSPNHSYITLVQNRQNSKGVFYTANVVTVISNLKNQSQYVGFAPQAYTNGQTATINTYGNNVSTLSGLSTSTMYYVQANGDLATTADGGLTGYFVTGTPVAGTALNSTTLLIRDPATRV
jgi:hypothetical protein